MPITVLSLIRVSHTVTVPNLIRLWHPLPCFRQVRAGVSKPFFLSRVCVFDSINVAESDHVFFDTGMCEFDVIEILTGLIRFVTMF